MLNTSETYLALEMGLEFILPPPITWLERAERLPLRPSGRDQSIRLVVADKEHMAYPIGHFSLLASTGM